MRSRGAPWWRNGSTHSSTAAQVPIATDSPAQWYYGLDTVNMYHVPHIVAQKKRKERHSKPFARFRAYRRRGERGAVVAKLPLCKDARRDGLDVILISRFLHVAPLTPAELRPMETSNLPRGAWGATPHEIPSGERQPSRGDVSYRKKNLGPWLRELEYGLYTLYWQLGKNNFCEPWLLRM
jgi:hypothetical protein